MKKSLLYIPVVALALGSCSNTQDLIFDESAAERLESSKDKAIETLTADGGLWAMEYFANTDEQGYVMLVRFDKNGSVTVSGDHEWIAGNGYVSKFTQDTSLWGIASDNGTVLSFNTYNNVFSVFADPANIVGPNAPTNPDRDNADIDETGYGHEGDYEFMLMTSDDPNTVRLLGKKRGLYTYLRKLDSATDEEEYFKQLAAQKEGFTNKFPTLMLTDAAGLTYEMNDLAKCTPSVFPRNQEIGGKLYEGDAITQTTEGCGIFTMDGFRMAKPMTVKRADESEFEIYNFKWDADGFLVDEEAGVKISAFTPVENFLKNSWTVDLTSFTGKFAEAYEAAAAAVTSHLGSKYPLKGIEFSKTTYNKVLTPMIQTSLGTRACRDFVEYTNKVDGDIQLANFIGANEASALYNKDIPGFWEFKSLFMQELKLENGSPFNALTIKCSLTSDPASSFVLKVK